MTKTHKIYDWEDWVSLCEEHKVDPYAYADFSRSTGGGDIDYFEYEGDIPEEED